MSVKHQNVLRTIVTRCGALLVVGGLLVCAAAGDVFTPLTSYEPSETDLTVTASAGDSGLTVTIVPGGVGGAPAATDGSYVLRVDVSNETDRKVEFRHNWSTTTYDLDGEDELLADVYISSSGALPGLMGIWSLNWAPPDEWQGATNIPAAVGTWTTVSFNVTGRSQSALNNIWAFIFEDMAGTSGVAYVDNLRFRHTSPDAPRGFAVLGRDGQNDVTWRPYDVAGLEGYTVYRAEAEAGPYTALNATLVTDTLYADEVGTGAPRYYYYVTATVDGDESTPSAIASAQWDGFSDEQLLDWVQQQTFRYFWDYGHPVSGMARETLTASPDTCASGGTGMGLMAIVVGAERGFVTRADAAERILQILSFLQDDTTRYHGAWSHWINGTTGVTIPFSENDDGGDLVETSYVAQGLLTVRQYFNDPVDATEIEIRSRATSMWEGIEWDWYRRYAGSDVLYWHWSPNVGWAMNMTIRGYNEAMIVYLLAIASPTHPMPASSFHNGWAGAAYVNGGSYYGIPIYVGPAYGGPLFFTHYSHMGFDPRYKRDAYCDYFENSRNIALIHQAYAIDNPLDYMGYHRWFWGLTASASPPTWYYLAHSPTNDNGTVAPTAALSSTPFTPRESMDALRYMLDNYTPELTGPYGLYDALNPTLGWISDTHIAIDQGPIVVMIENYRTGLCWRLFMSNSEIAPMMQAIGMYYYVDFDEDGDVGNDDFNIFAVSIAGEENTLVPPGSTPAQFAASDLDNDADVDLRDAAVFQQLFNEP